MAASGGHSANNLLTQFASHLQLTARGTESVEHSVLGLGEEVRQLPCFAATTNAPSCSVCGYPMRSHVVFKIRNDGLLW